MIDAFDLIAFAVFAVLIAVFVIVVVLLGSLPGRIARQRGHPQAAAVNVASWLGVATLGLLWPLALIWAFLNPRPAVAPGGSAQLDHMQARVDALEGALSDLRTGKGVAP